MLAGGRAKTLPVAIASFNTFRGLDLGAMSAAILVSVAPVLLASFFVQRRLIRGISADIEPIWPDIKPNLERDT